MSEIEVLNLVLNQIGDLRVPIREEKLIQQIGIIAGNIQALLDAITASKEKAKKKAAAYQRSKKLLSSKPMQALFPNALENLRSKHGSADYKAASPMMRQVLVNTVNEDLSALLPECKPETLLIWGRNDDAAPYEDGQRMEKEMPDAGLVTIENAGHFAFIEQQYMFLRVLASFLGLELD